MESKELLSALVTLPWVDLADVLRGLSDQLIQECREAPDDESDAKSDARNELALLLAQAGAKADDYGRMD